MAVVPLQPRPATTGNLDVLQLQPRLLPNYDRISRECRSEPKDIMGMRTLLTDFNAPKIDTELGVTSVPAMAIGSSTEVLVSILENQAGLRRNSFLSTSSASNIQDERRSNKSAEERIQIEEVLKSPDDDEFIKSPSTEMTNPSDHSSSMMISCGISRDEDSRSTLDCENCVGNIDDCDKLYNRTS